MTTVTSPSSAASTSSSTASASIRDVVTRAWRLVGPGHRRPAVMVVPLGVVAALVELVCAGAIFALVEVMMRQAPALSASTTALSASTTVTTATTATTSLGLLWATNVSVPLLSVVMVGLFVVKGVITSVVHHHQHGVTEQLRRDLMVRVLRQALSSPWLVHLERGPAAVHHDLTHNVDTVVDDVMAPAAQAGVNVLIMAALIVPLLLAAPIPTVTALLVMATWTLGLHRLTRGLAKRVGHTEQVARRRGQRVLAGALGALRELRALGRTEAVVAEYRDALEGRVRARQLRGTLSAQPRVWSESLVVIALAVAVGVGLADVTTFPVLGAGAYAAMRIMPLANGTVWLLWRMRSGSTALSSLSSLASLSSPSSSSSSSTTTTTAPSPPLAGAGVSIADVAFAYGDAGDVFVGATLDIAAGDSVAVMGPSGAGKSTLLGLVVGTHEAKAGRVHVNGRAPRDVDVRVGFVPQESTLMEGSIADNICVGAPELRDDPTALQGIMSIVGLDDAFGVDSGAVGDIVVGEGGARVSGGQRQRIALARAIAHRPALLVLDEATAALDPDSEAAVMARLITWARPATTIIMVTHRREVAERCARQVHLDGHRLVEVQRPT